MLYYQNFVSRLTNALLLKNSFLMSFLIIMTIFFTQNIFIFASFCYGRIQIEKLTQPKYVHDIGAADLQMDSYKLCQEQQYISKSIPKHLRIYSVSIPDTFDKSSQIFSLLIMNWWLCCSITFFYLLSSLQQILKQSLK
ncbi:unnamed protein product (macronuclear) [Paramecium tetraurelia]|uniref:Transmembrane protein n=1 Tax=Paramecium tetraurelia TaxID=5888 RepID=A0BM79_PARTE|nr:uncharacterized protein GSPATT00030280001 [Paramecium tetraurelia]CAK59646.1 unnamed protein product [Paramecium tetraurelia]|eukprot:XP_001427044.1 hypothetical protein (macronuclear) [Paramecium tetraurelia strain d4-2]